MIAIGTPTRPVTANAVGTTSATTVRGATDDEIVVPISTAPSRSRANALDTLLRGAFIVGTDTICAFLLGDEGVKRWVAGVSAWRLRRRRCPRPAATPAPCRAGPV